MIKPLPQSAGSVLGFEITGIVSAEEEPNTAGDDPTNRATQFNRSVTEI
jgi:hypothetical protein